MDRQLVVEFPYLIVNEARPPGSGVWELNPTDTRRTSAGLYVQEQKIDLSGYVQSDLTVGFRRSFEQDGAFDSIYWAVYNPNTDPVYETVIISSVPFTDEQLLAALTTSPGFTVVHNAALDSGNFNRSHIIHGSYRIHYANSVVGAGAFTTPGNATLTPLVDNIFSSLEPTAADCLYCYRAFSFPNPDGQSGISQLALGPKRVILDAFTVEEPDLEYMMRLKRSYELANQV